MIAPIHLFLRSDVGGFPLGLNQGGVGNEAAASLLRNGLWCKSRALRCGGPLAWCSSLPEVFSPYKAPRVMVEVERVRKRKRSRTICTN